MRNGHLVETLKVLAREKPPEIRNFRICAGVIHKHREIISIGYPRRKSHPLQAQFGPREQAVYLHAEVEALIRALKVNYEVTKNTSLYVVRVKHKGPYYGVAPEEFEEACASPCKGCLGFIKHCGVTQVYWTG